MEQPKLDHLAAAAAAYEQWLSSGVVKTSYLRELLGDMTASVTASRLPEDACNYSLDSFGDTPTPPSTSSQPVTGE